MIYTWFNFISKLYNKKLKLFHSSLVDSELKSFVFVLNVAYCSPFGLIFLTLVFKFCHLVNWTRFLPFHHLQDHIIGKTTEAMNLCPSKCFLQKNKSREF